jgi:AcrR family transcriptional regulator
MARGLAAANEGPAPASEPQALGPKGLRTRKRIMEATAELLKDRAFGDIKITEIARIAGVTQPNFYTYFKSTEEVVLALAETFLQEPQQLEAYFADDWAGPGGLEQARGLVQAAIQLVGRNRPLLGWVNLLADKMHGEFPAMRIRIWRGVYKAFEAEVREAQAAGRISRMVQPRLAGYECVGILLSICVRYELLRDSGFTHGQLVNTTAALLHAMATGQPPDDQPRPARRRGKPAIAED